MPIALEMGGEIKRSGFAPGIGCTPIYESLEIAGEGKRVNSPPPPPPPPAEEASTCTSSSSSSIGRNSESFGSDGEELAGEKEVESPYKGPLGALESLEEALPVRYVFPKDRNSSVVFKSRRGISNFYSGKSKSFASLSDVMVSCASIKDLGKQENAYTRNRRNLLASKNFCLKSSSTLLRSNRGGISKKCPSNGRSTLALAVAMSNSSSSQEDQDQQYQLLPPLHPSGKNSAADSCLPQYCLFPSRSFSLTDLQAMAGSGSSVGLKDAHKRFH